MELDPPPTSEQRAALSQLIYRALLDIRAHAARGDAREAFLIADALHNLPVAVHRPEGWLVAWARRDLADLPDSVTCDYLAEFDRIFPPGSYLEEV